MEDLKLKKCTICLEDILTDIEFLPCTHAFHQECIAGWVSSNPTCPICKIPIYVNSPEQLDLYNHYKNRQDQIAEQESRFFQQVSAGVFDNHPNEAANEMIPNPNILNEMNPNMVRARELTTLISTLFAPGSGVMLRRLNPSMTQALTQLRNVDNTIQAVDILLNQPNQLVNQFVNQDINPDAGTENIDPNNNQEMVMDEHIINRDVDNPNNGHINIDNSEFNSVNFRNADNVAYMQYINIDNGVADRNFIGPLRDNEDVYERIASNMVFDLHDESGEPVNDQELHDLEPIDMSGDDSIVSGLYNDMESNSDEHISESGVSNMSNTLSMETPDS